MEPDSVIIYSLGSIYSRLTTGFFYFCFMPEQKFQILPIIDKASSLKLRYIYHQESGLKIMIYPLHINRHFQPSNDELCFYGQLFQWWHAFETIGFQEHQLDLIPAALEWFAALSFYPQMRPQLNDPRLEALLPVPGYAQSIN